MLDSREDGAVPTRFRLSLGKGKELPDAAVFRAVTVLERRFRLLVWSGHFLRLRSGQACPLVWRTASKRVRVPAPHNLAKRFAGGRRKPSSFARRTAEGGCPHMSGSQTEPLLRRAKWVRLGANVVLTSLAFRAKLRYRRCFPPEFSSNGSSSYVRSRLAACGAGWAAGGTRECWFAAERCGLRV